MAGLIFIMKLFFVFSLGCTNTNSNLMLNTVWFCRGSVSYPHSLTQLETIPGYYWETGNEWSKGSRWGISGFWKCQNNFMFGASIVTWHLLASGCAFCSRGAFQFLSCPPLLQDPDPLWLLCLLPGNFHSCMQLWLFLIPKHRSALNSSIVSPQLPPYGILRPFLLRSQALLCNLPVSHGSSAL